MHWLATRHKIHQVYQKHGRAQCLCLYHYLDRHQPMQDITAGVQVQKISVESFASYAEVKVCHVNPEALSVYPPKG